MASICHWQHDACVLTVHEMVMLRIVPITSSLLAIPSYSLECKVNHTLHIIAINMSCPYCAGTVIVRLLTTLTIRQQCLVRGFITAILMPLS